MGPHPDEPTQALYPRRTRSSFDERFGARTGLTIGAVREFAAFLRFHGFAPLPIWLRSESMVFPLGRPRVLYRRVGEGWHLDFLSRGEQVSLVLNVAGGYALEQGLARSCPDDRARSADRALKHSIPRRELCLVTGGRSHLAGATVDGADARDAVDEASARILDGWRQRDAGDAWPAPLVR
ncbi:hypothetical protein [Agromyces sp. LHK192]|uniref:hypothetical protein n=1 Tax=Agromyces sp. LHK192 TaxID=2498704 RepID=UPI000FDC8186|nr:hypothetical protein [Agromyces sp. LHK192]